MSVAEQLVMEDRILIIALVVAAVSAYVLWRVGVRRAGRGKPRHAAGPTRLPVMDPQRSEQIRAELVAAAATASRNYVAAPDGAYVLPFNVREIDARPAAPRCTSYIHGGQS